MITGGLTADDRRVTAAKALNNLHVSVNSVQRYIAGAEAESKSESKVSQFEHNTGIE